MEEVSHSNMIIRDMTPAEIASTYNKSINAVNVGISRMVKDHPEWKKKEDNRVTILAEGVEWLVTDYFNMGNQLSVNVEIIKLQAEADKYKRLYEDQLKNNEKMDFLYNQLAQQAINNARQTHLLEQKSKDNQIQEQEKEIERLKTENERLKNRSFWERLLNK